MSGESTDDYENGSKQLPVDPEDLECEVCGKTIGGESLDDYARRLSNHILDEHDEEASPFAIYKARKILRGEAA